VGLSNNSLSKDKHNKKWRGMKKFMYHT
jgi:hypothetical protein